MKQILFVRVKSELELEDLERRLLERLPRFREVPGLLQKIYGREEATGAVCGMYFFESEKAVSDFAKSELAQTIPSAYEATDVRREAYGLLCTLWPDRGPFSDDAET